MFCACFSMGAASQRPARSNPRHPNPDRTARCCAHDSAAPAELLVHRSSYRNRYGVFLAIGTRWMGAIHHQPGDSLAMKGRIAERDLAPLGAPVVKMRIVFPG